MVVGAVSLHMNNEPLMQDASVKRKHVLIVGQHGTKSHLALDRQQPKT